MKHVTKGHTISFLIQFARSILLVALFLPQTPAPMWYSPFTTNRRSSTMFDMFTTRFRSEHHSNIAYKTGTASMASTKQFHQRPTTSNTPLLLSALTLGLIPHNTSVWQRETTATRLFSTATNSPSLPPATTRPTPATPPPIPSAATRPPTPPSLPPATSRPTPPTPPPIPSAATAPHPTSSPAHGGIGTVITILFAILVVVVAILLVITTRCLLSLKGSVEKAQNYRQPEKIPL